MNIEMNQSHRHGALHAIAVPIVLSALFGHGKLVAEDKPLVFDYPGFRAGWIVVADMPGHIGTNYASWRLNRTHTTRYAAEFLQRYIQLVTGEKLGIVSATHATAAPYRPIILLGKSKLTEFVEADRRKLPPEGFIIRRKDRQVAIVGEIAPEDDMPEYRGADRGTLFGVYEFLERVYGVRWYFPGELGVHIPKRKHVAVRALDITSAPHYRMRLAGLRPAIEPGPFNDLHPCTRSGNTTGFWTNHTYFNWYKYVDEHPEIFSVDANGKRNVTNKAPQRNAQNHVNFLHPKVLELDMQRLKEFEETRARHWNYSLWPNSRYVRFFPRDNENVYPDMSPASRALWTPDRENSTLSEVIFGYAAKFARAVGKEYPGKRLAFPSYAGYLYPPLTVKMPDNADVLICTVKGNSLLVSKSHWDHNVDVVNQWYEHLGKDRSRVFLWEYFCYPIHHLQLYPHVMQRWLQVCRDKVMGAFNNGFPNRGGYSMKYRLSIPNGWIWHQLLWNPDADVDALLDRFCKDLFGPAAPAMSQALNMSIKQYETAARKLTLNPGASSYIHPRHLYGTVYPKQFMALLRAEVGKARKAAKPDSIQARRVTFFAEAFDEMFKEADEFYKAFGPPPKQSVPKINQRPKIDGKLDDPAWKDTKTFGLGGWRTGRTEEAATAVYLAHDDKTLFVGARFDCPDATKLIANGSRRDDPAIARDDFFAVDLDAVTRGTLDLPSFFRIMVNPSGQVADGVKVVPLVDRNLHRSAWYDFWNPPDIEAASHKAEDHWSLELAIPLAALGERDGNVRAQFVRQNRSSHRGLYSWSPMLMESYEYDLARMGFLEFE